MKILKIYNDDLSVDVQYKTDIVTNTQTNFTVMEIIGLDDDEKKLGIDFKKLPYNLPIFKQFAEENGFGLSLQNIGSSENSIEEVLVEPSENTDDQ